MFRQVMRVRVARAAIRPMRRGLEEVKVDAVHGFRPGQDCPLGMPENLQYSQSAKSLERKLILRVTLARPALPLASARL
jgi:hypothetical protein